MEQPKNGPRRERRWTNSPSQPGSGHFTPVVMGLANLQSGNQEQLKNLIKTALIEVLKERQDLLHNAIEDAIEDVALAHAIEEGEGTEFVEREGV